MWWGESVWKQARNMEVVSVVTTVIFHPSTLMLLKTTRTWVCSLVSYTFSWPRLEKKATQCLTYLYNVTIQIAVAVHWEYFGPRFWYNLSLRFTQSFKIKFLIFENRTAKLKIKSLIITISIGLVMDIEVYHCLSNWFSLYMEGHTGLTDQHLTKISQIDFSLFANSRWISLAKPQ